MLFSTFNEKENPITEQNSSKIIETIMKQEHTGVILNHQVTLRTYCRYKNINFVIIANIEVIRK